MKAGARILLIDDSPQFRELLRGILEDRGFSVVEAGDGEQALESMKKVPFNLAIVDLDMPRMNGLEFTKRAKQRNPAFPVIMVTAYSQFYSPGDILASGVDAFLQKPVDFDKLTKAIERV
jgi:CheY-like chemotaxis protein